MTQITQNTVLTSQEKQAFFEKQTTGKGETFKARYSALFNDSRSFAFMNPQTGKPVKASLDMLNCATGHEVYGFTEKVNAEIEALGLDASRMYRAEIEGCNMKALKRFHQMLHALGSVNHLGVDTVSLIIIFSLSAAGKYALSRDALFYMGTGQVMYEGFTPNTRGVSRTAICARIAGFSSVHAETMKTKISRSIGTDGFLTNVGAVERIVNGRGSKDVSYKLNPENPLVKKFFSVFDNLNAGQVEEIIESLNVNK